jgi:hypothetical protein
VKAASSKSTGGNDTMVPSGVKEEKERVRERERERERAVGFGTRVVYLFFEKTSL